MIRLVATGDLHIRANDSGTVAPRLADATRNADVLLIAGDITEHGWVTEAERAHDLLSGIQVPILAVLGNHDLRAVRRLAFRGALARAGVTLLDGASTVLRAESGHRIGFVGVSGCGGGFWSANDPEAIHARAWNTISVRQRREAAKLDAGLSSLAADVRIVLMHFAPTPSTLGREPGAKYWMLGNGELGRVIDSHPVDLVLHGHAHLGCKAGWTRRGTPVRNVAFPVNNDVVRLMIDGSEISEAPETGTNCLGLSA